MLIYSWSFSGPVLSTLLCSLRTARSLINMIGSNVRIVSALVSFLCFLSIQAIKQETFRKGGWLLFCIAFQ